MMKTIAASLVFATTFAVNINKPTEYKGCPDKVFDSDCHCFENGVNPCYPNLIIGDTDQPYHLLVLDSNDKPDHYECGWGETCQDPNCKLEQCNPEKNPIKLAFDKKQLV